MVQVLLDRDPLDRGLDLVLATDHRGLDPDPDLDPGLDPGLDPDPDLDRGLDPATDRDLAMDPAMVMPRTAAYYPYGWYSPYGYYTPYTYTKPTYIQPQYGKILPVEPKRDKLPQLVLYVAAGDGIGPGKVYQVEGTDGRVMGKENFDQTPTGISMYGDHGRELGVVVAIPRDGGKVVEIDDTGKQSTILEKDPALPHPVKISMAGNSNTMVVADDLAYQLVMSTIEHTKTKVYQKFDPSYSSQPMSVAVANDKDVLFSSNAKPGVHKFSGDQSARGDKPILPTSGGVAADHGSLRWAAAQVPNVIKVYEGRQFLKNLRLPPQKKFYKGGLMSFGPDGSLCVAVQDSDNEQGDVWILCFHVDKEQVTNSFKWTHEEMQDFAVGSRMPWNQHSASPYKSTF